LNYNKAVGATRRPLSLEFILRKVLTFFLTGLAILSAPACKRPDQAVRSQAFRTDLTGGEVQWIYWTGKKGSVALWLVPVESQEPLLTLTCTKGDRKMNVRGYAFQSYAGSNGPVMFMAMEGGGVNLRSRLSWAPTEETPIAQADMRVKAADLEALAKAAKVTFGVEGERYTFNGFGAAGKAFPGGCTKALGLV